MDTPWCNGPFHEVAAGVFAARCEPAGVTVGLVVGGEDALLVDAGTYPAQGAALVEEAERFAGVPVDSVVLTHAHWDHWFGASGLAAHVVHPGAPLPADTAPHHARTLIGHVSLWDEDAADPEQLERLAVPAPPAPRTVLADRLALDLGDLPVQVRHLGPAHTRGDLVVLVPERGVILAGDLVEESGDPQCDVNTELAGWVAALDQMLALAERMGSSREGGGQGIVVVPGHGRPVDLDFVRAQREWIADRARAAGLDVDDAE